MPGGGAQSVDVDGNIILDPERWPEQSFPWPGAFPVWGSGKNALQVQQGNPQDGEGSFV